jgi:hypothetical protein
MYLSTSLFNGVGIPENPVVFSAAYAGEVTTTDPNTNEGHYLGFRARGIYLVPGGGVQAQAIIYTNSGGTIVKHWSLINGAGGPGWETFRLALTTGEAATITDYTDIRLLVFVEIPTYVYDPEVPENNGPFDVDLDWIAFETPDGMAFPYADFYSGGWSDELNGNNNGVYWDELNHATFDYGKRVSSEQKQNSFNSQEAKTEVDSSSHALSGTSQENPNDVFSSENNTSTSTAVIGTQS